jgi:hypothetical protein
MSKQLTQSDGVPMLPTSSPAVAVSEVFDDKGNSMWMVKISASGAELTIGRRRDRERAEEEAQRMRANLPGIDTR